MPPAEPTAKEASELIGSRGQASRRRQDEDRELDHRLANSLQLAADFLIFEHTRVTDARARAALIETAERLAAVGQMHRFLAKRHQSDGINLDPFLTELGALVGDTTGLKCSVDADPLVVDAETAQQLAIAVNELAMNAAKHAYSWGDHGALHVTCRRRGSGLALIVADEGAGLSTEFCTQGSSGLGMSILYAIVRQLRGTLEAVNDNGARFTITIPLPPPPAPIRRSFAPGD